MTGLTLGNVVIQPTAPSYPQGALEWLLGAHGVRPGAQGTPSKDEDSEPMPSEVTPTEIGQAALRALLDAAIPMLTGNICSGIDVTESTYALLAILDSALKGSK